MPKNNIPLDYLRACFDVDFAAGTLTWRTRPPDHFSRVNNRWQAWNTEYSGQIAGTPNGNGYLSLHLTFDGKTHKFYVHIIIWSLAHGAWPPRKIDHRDGIRDHNWLSNLREATSSENSHNMGKKDANTSGFPGVVQHGNDGVIAQIAFDSRHHYLGHYPNREDAFRVYLAAKAILHPFAPTPRGVPVPELRAVDRMRAAHRIVKAARGHGDTWLELDAWQHFIDAM